ncbi:threonine/serine dehydratase [Flindersiella endophytica]
MYATDVENAEARISGRVRRTPVVGTASATVWLKLEQLQHTGSFKPRGMFNRVLSARERGELPESGVIVASGGNAGLAVAHVAAELSVPAEVFVPTITPAVKVAKLRKLGARVVQQGGEYAEAYEAATKRAIETGALFCHAYDQPEVVAGQGTAGLEILEQVPDVTTVLVAVGGGGLIGGIAAALEGSARVVAVEPENCPTLHAALAAGAPVDVSVSGLAADSLGARRVGDIAFEVLTRVGAGAVLVPDSAIADARRELWDSYRLVTESGGAAAYAALASGAYRPSPGERVCVLICGANTDPSDLTRDLA